MEEDAVKDKHWLASHCQPVRSIWKALTVTVWLGPNAAKMALPNTNTASSIPVTDST